MAGAAMNREKAKALLPIITAFAEGKTIQLRYGKDDWCEAFSPDWTADVDRYRVKREPREYGIILRKDGSVVRACPLSMLDGEVADYNRTGARQSMPYTGIVVVEKM